MGNCAGRRRWGTILIDLQAAQRKAALDKLNAGDPAGAAFLLKAMLAEDGDNADLLGLLGVALEETGDKDGGAEALRRAVALPADPSIAFRNVSNLAALLFDGGRHEDAADLLRQGWLWPAERGVEPRDRSSIGLLARIMNALRLWEEVVALALPIVEASQADWGIASECARALAMLGRSKDGLRVLEENAAGDRDELEYKALLAYLYSEAGFVESALKARDAYVAKAPAYLAPARPGQRLTVGVINPATPRRGLIYPFASRHFAVNFPVRLANRLAERYRFASIMQGAGPAAVEQFRAYKPSVVLNNVVNAEILMSGDNLEQLQRLAGATGAPLINAPANAAKTTRQMNAAHLAGIPNLIIPRLSRFNRDGNRLDELVLAIEGAFAYPLIIRTTAEHDSVNLTLVRSRSMLRELLARQTERQIYVIQYLGAPRRDGFYRRVRTAFVEGVPIVIRADYAPDWVVTNRAKSTVEVYNQRPDLLADADEIVNEPMKRLGAAAMATLEAVGRTIPMEIFGMDFDIDDEGRVIFFEANAAMSLISSRTSPYPAEADKRLIDHIDQLLHRRATHSKPAALPVG
jgi:Flp pilus assembly protein TadD